MYICRLISFFDLLYRHAFLFDTALIICKTKVSSFVGTDKRVVVWIVTVYHLVAVIHVYNVSEVNMLSNVLKERQIYDRRAIEL